MNGTDSSSLRLDGFFRAPGVDIEIRTDSISVVCAAEELFTPVSQPASEKILRLVVRTDPAIQCLPPWPKPDFRVDGRRFHVEFGVGNRFVMDIDSRTVTASVAKALSHDVNYWRSMVLPAIFGTMCYTAGVCVLHCACIARDGRGILLAAPAGTGKSTLTYALAKRGFEVLSDDWTYLYRENGRLVAAGLPVPMKLLDDCQKWFPEFANHAPAVNINGELAYEFDPADLGLTRTGSCEPVALLFLERASEFSLRPVGPNETARRFAADFLNLPECFSGYDDLLQAAAADLSAIGSFVFGFHCDPNQTAAHLCDRLGSELDLAVASATSV